MSGNIFQRHCGKPPGVLLVCLTLIAFLVGCGSQNEHLSKGKELIKSTKRRKEEKAVVAFKRAVVQEPDNAEAQYLLGYYNSEREIDMETADALGRLGIRLKDDGVIVNEVQPQSPASLEYYMEVGDKIQTVDGKEIQDVTDYEAAIKQAMGVRKTVKMRLKASPEMRGERMYLAYKNDKKKYLEILVYETLRDREQEIQEAALKAIKQIYSKGDKKDRAKLLKALFDAIKSKDNRDRHDASLALAHLGNRRDGDPKTIVPKLIDLLDHKRMQTRLNAVLALGEIGDKSAIEPLVKRIASGSEEEKKKRENPEVRRLAVEALGKIGKTDDPNVRRLVVDNLIQLLENKGSSMRVDAIEALMEIGDENAVPSLLYVLEEKGSRKVEVKF